MKYIDDFLVHVFDIIDLFFVAHLTEKQIKRKLKSIYFELTKDCKSSFIYLAQFLN